MNIYQQLNYNRRKTLLIFLLFIIIFSGFFYLIGIIIGDSQYYLILGLLISFSSTFISYFFSDKIILLSLSAVPANKRDHFNLFTVTENLAIATGLPMPKLYVINDQSLNAMATGRDYRHAIICVTTGLLNRLDRAELEGVIAHELSHIKNYDSLIMSVVAVLIGSITIVADWLIRSLWWGSSVRSNDRNNRNPLALIFVLFVLIITPVVASLIQLAISRQREYLADANGALITRYPEGLARALEKINAYQLSLQTATTATAHLFISSPFKHSQRKNNWWITLFSTHPPIEDRIRVLRSM